MQITILIGILLIILLFFGCTEQNFCGDSICSPNENCEIDCETIPEIVNQINSINTSTPTAPNIEDITVQEELGITETFIEETKEDTITQEKTTTEDTNTEEEIVYEETEEEDITQVMGPPPENEITYTFNVDLTNPTYDYTSPDGYRTRYKVHYLNLPINPTSTLIKNMFADLNNGTTLMIYDTNIQTWRPYSKTRIGWMDSERNPNVEIVPGQGFVIYVYHEGEIKVTGTPITKAPTINLKGKNNLIGIPYGYENQTASDILKEIGELAPACKTMFQVEEANNRWWTTDPDYNTEKLNEKFEKTDFSIDNNKAYWIICDENTNIEWTHTVEFDLCGNGICDNEETENTCSLDCTPDPCGNGICDDGETPSTCSADCPLDLCGNGYCDNGETKNTCKLDCSAKLKGEIRNCTDLQNMQNKLSGNYYLSRDIDCSDTINWNDGNGFAPIGEEDSPDKERSWLPDNLNDIQLNGNNHTIKNLYINRPEEAYVGIFKKLVNSYDIKNINLIDANIKGNTYVGGLAGYAKNSRFSNNNVTGRIYGKSKVGGIVGKTWGIQGGLFNNTFDGTILGRKYVGGIIGEVGGIIAGSGDYYGHYVIEKNSSNGSFHHYPATKKYTSIEIGGIVGEASNTIIRNNYSTANVQGIVAGGIIGQANDYVEIYNNYFNGTIEEPNLIQTGKFGGIVGHLPSTYTKVETNYNVGTVYSYESAGGIIGKTWDYNINKTSNNYWDKILSGQEYCYMDTNVGCVSTDNNELAYFGPTGIPFTKLKWSTSIWQSDENTHPTLK